MNKWLVIGVVLLSTNAFAGFINEAGDSPFDGTEQVKIFGAGKVTDTVVGLGRDVGLSEAIIQIVPKGYTVRTVGVERWIHSTISWQGGQPWVDVLRASLRSIPEVQAEIDTDQRIVTLRPSTDAKRVVATDATGQTEWQIRADDKTVKAMFARWAQASGWQLSWDLPVDYPIGASGAIQGSFERAVETVIRALQSSDVAPKVIFYNGNRVFHITARGTE